MSHFQLFFSSSLPRDWPFIGCTHAFIAFSSLLDRHRLSMAVVITLHIVGRFLSSLLSFSTTFSPRRYFFDMPDTFISQMPCCQLIFSSFSFPWHRILSLEYLPGNSSSFLSQSHRRGAMPPLYSHRDRVRDIIHVLSHLHRIHRHNFWHLYYRLTEEMRYSWVFFIETE